MPERSQPGNNYPHFSVHRLRQRAAQGLGEQGADQAEVDRLFVTSPEGGRPDPHVIDADDVTRGLGLAPDLSLRIAQVVRETRADYSTKSAQQRIIAARGRLIAVMRAMVPHVPSDARQEVMRRAISYWKAQAPIDLGRTPQMRFGVGKSEAGDLMKAKYRKRVATGNPKRPWRYIYDEGQGPAKARESADVEKLTKLIGRIRPALAALRAKDIPTSAPFHALAGTITAGMTLADKLYKHLTGRSIPKKKVAPTPAEDKPKSDKKRGEDKKPRKKAERKKVGMLARALLKAYRELAALLEEAHEGAKVVEAREATPKAHTQEALLAAGGKLWEAHGKRRVYFNSGVTGVQRVKVWFDLVKLSWGTRGADKQGLDKDKIIASMEERMKGAEKAPKLQTPEVRKLPPAKVKTSTPKPKPPTKVESVGNLLGDDKLLALASAGPGHVVVVNGTPRRVKALFGGEGGFVHWEEGGSGRKGVNIHFVDGSSVLTNDNSREARWSPNENTIFTPANIGSVGRPPKPGDGKWELYSGLTIEEVQEIPLDSEERVILDGLYKRPKKTKKKSLRYEAMVRRGLVSPHDGFHYGLTSLGWDVRNYAHRDQVTTPGNELKPGELRRRHVDTLRRVAGNKGALGPSSTGADLKRWGLVQEDSEGNHRVTAAGRAQMEANPAQEGVIAAQVRKEREEAAATALRAAEEERASAYRAKTAARHKEQRKRAADKATQEARREKKTGSDLSALVEASADIKSPLLPEEMVEKMGGTWFVTHHADGQKTKFAGLDFSTKKDALDQAQKEVTVWHAKNGFPLPYSLRSQLETFEGFGGVGGATKPAPGLQELREESTEKLFSNRMRHTSFKRGGAITVNGSKYRIDRVALALGGRFLTLTPKVGSGSRKTLQRELRVHEDGTTTILHRVGSSPERVTSLTGGELRSRPVDYHTPEGKKQRVAEAGAAKAEEKRLKARVKTPEGRRDIAMGLLGSELLQLDKRNWQVVPLKLPKSGKRQDLEMQDAGLSNAKISQLVEAGVMFTRPKKSLIAAIPLSKAMNAGWGTGPSGSGGPGSRTDSLPDFSIYLSPEYQGRREQELLAAENRRDAERDRARRMWGPREQEGGSPELRYERQGWEARYAERTKPMLGIRKPTARGAKIKGN